MNINHVLCLLQRTESKLGDSLTLKLKRFIKISLNAGWKISWLWTLQDGVSTCTCTNRCAINDLIASNQSSFGSQLDLLCICFQVQFVSVCVFVVCASSFPPGEMLTLQHMVCYSICSKAAPWNTLQEFKSHKLNFCHEPDKKFIFYSHVFNLKMNWHLNRKQTHKLYKWW